MLSNFNFNKDQHTISSLIETIILSVFPKVSTHLNHTADQSLSTQLFPHDYIIAAIAVSFNRYTLTFNKEESRFSRLFWSCLLGYLGWNDYDYWILTSLHLVSFYHVLFRYLKGVFCKVRVEYKSCFWYPYTAL